MEVNPTKSLSKRRTSAEIRQLLREQEESSCSIKEFCAARSIVEGTFFNWRKKYSAGRQQTDNFITLQLDKGNESSSLFAEIEHPAKTVIRLFRQVDPSYLKALL